MRDHAIELLLAAAFLSPAVGLAKPDPQRRAAWGFRLVSGDRTPGAEVRGLDPGSPAHRAGLRDHDQVLAINGLALDGARTVARARRASRGGDQVRLEVSRPSGRASVTFLLPALPEERLPGCEVHYGWVESPRGYRVRTVLTLPMGAHSRLPVVVFIPWLSCDPVEGPAGNPDGWLQLLYGLAETSGWAIYRVEKPGVGDSEGPDCSENDLETDLAAFRAALDQVSRLPGVDSSRIVLFGGSIGGALVPILAGERRVAGIITAGGFSRTWFEHMLEIERARLTLEGAKPADISQQMRAFSEFYALYLNQRLTPAQVLARRPALGRFWYDAPDGQYGRPAAYFHQVAALDVERAWAALEAPVLILHGEYDWIMSPAEAEHAEALVNAQGGRRAERVVLPRTDHNFGVYASRLDAYRDQGRSFDRSLVKRVAEWLNRRVPATASPAPH